MLKKILMVGIVLFIVASILSFATAIGVYVWATSDLPNFTKIKDYNPAQTTRIYAQDGTLLREISYENRILISLPEMGKIVPMCFLAAEDSSFYQHPGVNIKSVVRAVLELAVTGKFKTGGSTITQQTVKSLILTPEKTLERKIKEMILAYRLEKNLKKDEILTVYLNQIYLGSGAHGVEAAARTYFGVSAKNLTIAQAALIAGLTSSPSRHSPYSNMQSAISRQHYVLGRLYSLNWITKDEYNNAMAEKIKLTGETLPAVGDYYVEEVRRQLIDKYGNDTVLRGGLRVYTALKLNHQRVAENALRRGLVDLSKKRGFRGPITHLNKKEWNNFLNNQNQLPKHSGDWVKALVVETTGNTLQVRFANETGIIFTKNITWAKKLSPDYSKILKAHNKTAPATIVQVGDVIWASIVSDNSSFVLALEHEPDLQGGLVSMEPDTGNIVAMVGGFDFSTSQFNRAVQAYRQPGSSFKPFVYTAALENGFTLGSVIMDSEVEFQQGTGKLWKPKNFENDFSGPTLLYTGLVKSKNVVTVRLANAIGIQKVIEVANRMGLTSKLEPNLSLALGSADVTIFNMCEAYSCFARMGSEVKGRLILEINDSHGKELWKNPITSSPALSPQIAYLMDYILQGVVQEGTGVRARALKRPVAAKTGTTNDEKDGWFIGFTPYLISGVYVGFDDPKPMGRGQTGAHTALPIWLDYRQKIESNYPIQPFAKPGGIYMHAVATPAEYRGNAASSYNFPFKEGTDPGGLLGDDNTNNSLNSTEENVLETIF